MRTLFVMAFIIAIRLRGTMEVSPDGTSWEPLIRNRNLPAYARTLADSFGQVKTEEGVCTLGPDSQVKVQTEGLQLEKGALRIQGRARILTPQGPIVSTDPTTDAVVLSQNPVVIEVYEGWVRLDNKEDVDEGERALWGKSVTREDASFKDVPLELRPRED